MRSHVLGLLVAGLLWAVEGRSQPPVKEDKTVAQDTKSATEGKGAEVRFVNGSTVYVTILQEPIEVQTDFGKLTVPPKDIRSIEFGLHLADGVEAKIQDALKQLASSHYRQRDAAVKELITLGAQAYPALHRAAKSKEPEVAQRAAAALKSIEAKVPARLLRLKEEDVIRTTRFTIIGRVVTTGIKARAEYFGELNLKPYQMMGIRWLETAGETEVLVDAARYGSAPGQWLDSGIQVDPHLDLNIIASGLVDLWPQGPGQYTASPGGMTNAQPLRRPGVPAEAAVVPGALVGRIGEDGTPFVIGERYSGRPSRSGKLYLHIGPSPWNNASTGTYRVRIASGHSLVDSGG
ncbi:MAG TPA: hypothetical protein VEL76_08100 [Gemmataceae bacterium]|nr:hypothetical protein [Gemmataceae bacterium]